VNKNHLNQFLVHLSIEKYNLYTTIRANILHYNKYYVSNWDLILYHNFYNFS